MYESSSPGRETNKNKKLNLGRTVHKTCSRFQEGRHGAVVLDLLNADEVIAEMKIVTDIVVEWRGVRVVLEFFSFYGLAAVFIRSIIAVLQGQYFRIVHLFDKCADSVHGEGREEEKEQVSEQESFHP